MERVPLKHGECAPLSIIRTLRVQNEELTPPSNSHVPGPHSSEQETQHLTRVFIKV